MAKKKEKKSEEVKDDIVHLDLDSEESAFLMALLMSVNIKDDEDGGMVVLSRLQTKLTKAINPDIGDDDDKALSAFFMIDNMLSNYESDRISKRVEAATTEKDFDEVVEFLEGLGVEKLMDEGMTLCRDDILQNNCVTIMIPYGCTQLNEIFEKVKEHYGENDTYLDDSYSHPTCDWFEIYGVY